jgi:Anti-sigma factor NepR
MTSRKPPPATDPLTTQCSDGDVPREGMADQELSGTMHNHPEPAPNEGEGLDPRLQAQIGQKLKLMFDEVANAPIPDKFLNLLSQLDSQEKSK